MERVVVEQFVRQPYLFAALGHDAQRRLRQHRCKFMGFAVAGQIQCADGRGVAAVFAGIAVDDRRQFGALLFQMRVQGDVGVVERRHARILGNRSDGQSLCLCKAQW